MPLRAPISQRRMPRESFEAAWKAHELLIAEYWRDQYQHLEMLRDSMEQWLFDLWWKPRVDASLLQLFVAYLEWQAWHEESQAQLSHPVPFAQTFPNRRRRYPSRSLADLGVRDHLLFESVSATE